MRSGQMYRSGEGLLVDAEAIMVSVRRLRMIGMDDWDRDEGGHARVQAVLAFGLTASERHGVALRLEHVPDQAAYLAGQISKTQVVLSPVQAEQLAHALMGAAQRARSTTN